MKGKVSIFPAKLAQDSLKFQAPAFKEIGLQVTL